MKVIILQGLPGSGKSTWAKEYCHSNKHFVRVCRDDLRNMRGDYWIPKQEDIITDWEVACVKSAIDNNLNVIIDAVHLSTKYIQQWRERLYGYGVDWEIKNFDTPLKECIRRDLLRPNSVGKEVIENMYYKYIEKITPIQQNTSLPACVLVDVDGTIALHNRGAFEWDKVITDIPNKPVIDLVKSLLYNDGQQVIFLSGRDGVCKEDTVEWLKKQFPILDVGSNKGFHEEFLFMRQEGDTRRDSIVKRELFDNHIRNNYYVWLVLDDRDQVVKMWRQMGFTCLQVAEGNF